MAQMTVRAEHDGKASMAGHPQQSFAHLNSSRFSDLFRLIDATSHSSDHDLKRKRDSAAAHTAPKYMGIADWAKARADLHIQKKRALSKSKPVSSSRSDPIAGPSKPSVSSLQQDQASSASYSPFSKAQLLARVATYTLASFSVHASVASRLPSSVPLANQEELQKSIYAVARWLEPIGLALYGWSHLPPHAAVQATEKGGRNKVHCQTCSAVQTVAADMSDLAMLSIAIANIRNAHTEWCPWRRRPCDPHLYTLGGSARTDVDADEVLRASSKLKARKIIADAASHIAEVLQAAGRGEETVKIPDEMKSEEESALASVVQPLLDDASSALNATLVTALLGWRKQKGSFPTTMVNCNTCGRKVNLAPTRMPSARGAKALFDPHLEHRRFCPWVSAESQHGRYLPPIQSVFELRSPTEDGSSASADEEKLLELLSGMHALTGVESTAMPGWRLSLTKLLGSADHRLQHRHQPAVTSSDHAANGGAEAEVSQMHRAKPRPSEVLKSARSMLYGLPDRSGHQA